MTLFGRTLGARTTSVTPATDQRGNASSPAGGPGVPAWAWVQSGGNITYGTPNGALVASIVPADAEHAPFLMSKAPRFIAFAGEGSGWASRARRQAVDSTHPFRLDAATGAVYLHGSLGTASVAFSFTVEVVSESPEAAWKGKRDTVQMSIAVGGAGAVVLAPADAAAGRRPGATTPAQAATAGNNSASVDGGLLALVLILVLLLLVLPLAWHDRKRRKAEAAKFAASEDVIEEVDVFGSPIVGTLERAAGRVAFTAAATHQAGSTRRSVAAAPGTAVAVAAASRLAAMPVYEMAQPDAVGAVGTLAVAGVAAYAEGTESVYPMATRASQQTVLLPQARRSTATAVPGRFVEADYNLASGAASGVDYAESCGGTRHAIQRPRVRRSSDTALPSPFVEADYNLASGSSGVDYAVACGGERRAILLPRARRSTDTAPSGRFGATTHSGAAGSGAAADYAVATNARDYNMAGGGSPLYESAAGFLVLPRGGRAGLVPSSHTAAGTEYSTASKTSAQYDTASRITMAVVGSSSTDGPDEGHGVLGPGARLASPYDVASRLTLPGASDMAGSSSTDGPAYDTARQLPPTSHYDVASRLVLTGGGGGGSASGIGYGGGGGGGSSSSTDGPEHELAAGGGGGGGGGAELQLLAPHEMAAADKHPRASYHEAQQQQQQQHDVYQVANTPSYDLAVTTAMADAPGAAARALDPSHRASRIYAEASPFDLPSAGDDGNYTIAQPWNDECGYDVRTLARGSGVGRPVSRMSTGSAGGSFIAPLPAVGAVRRRNYGGSYALALQEARPGVRRISLMGGVGNRPHSYASPVGGAGDRPHSYALIDGEDGYGEDEDAVVPRISSSTRLSWGSGGASPAASPMTRATLFDDMAMLAEDDSGGRDDDDDDDDDDLVAISGENLDAAGVELTGISEYDVHRGSEHLPESLDTSKFKVYQAMAVAQVVVAAAAAAEGEGKPIVVATPAVQRASMQHQGDHQDDHQSSSFWGVMNRRKTSVDMSVTAAEVAVAGRARKGNRRCDPRARAPAALKTNHEAMHETPAGTAAADASVEVAGVVPVALEADAGAQAERAPAALVLGGPPLGRSSSAPAPITDNFRNMRPSLSTMEVVAEI